MAPKRKPFLISKKKRTLPSTKTPTSNVHRRSFRKKAAHQISGGRFSGVTKLGKKVSGLKERASAAKARISSAAKTARHVAGIALENVRNVQDRNSMNEYERSMARLAQISYMDPKDRPASIQMLLSESDSQNFKDDDETCQLKNCTCKYQVERSNEFHAVYFCGKAERPKVIMVSIRGTVLTTIADIKSDFSIIKGDEKYDRRFRSELELVQNLIAEFPGTRILVAGHSLGGGIANFIGMNILSSGSEKNLEIHAFNAGARLSAMILQNLKDCKLSGCDHIFNYKIISDPVSNFAVQAGKTFLFKPKMNRLGLGSHGIDNFL